MDLPAQAVMQLKMFISLVKANPDILHNPKLSFFKEFIESFGGKIPPPSKESQPPPKSSPSTAPSGDAKKPDETPAEPESEESDLELDNSGVIVAEMEEPHAEQQEVVIRILSADEIMQRQASQRGTEEVVVPGDILQHTTLQRDTEMVASDAEEILSQRDTEMVVADSNAEEILSQRDTEMVVADSNAEEILPQRDTEMVVADSNAEEILSQRDTEMVVADSNAEEILPQRDTEMVVADSNAEEILPQRDTEMVVADSNAEEILPQRDTEVAVTPSDSGELVLWRPSESYTEIVIAASDAEELLQSDMEVVIAASTVEELLQQQISQRDTGQVIAASDADELLQQQISQRDTGQVIAASDADELLKRRPSVRLPGVREGSCIYGDGDGYFYHVSWEKAEARYLVCVRKQYGCKARARMGLANGDPIILSEKSPKHNHERDTTRATQISFLSRLKRRAKTERISLQKIFDDEAMRHPEAVNVISRKSAERSMKRVKKSHKQICNDTIYFQVVFYLELFISIKTENPDVVTTPLPEYNCDLEVSEENFEKFEQHKGDAIRAYQDGEYQKAFDCYTKAIEANPNIAAMYAKRGQCCLKMSQPNACIRDCDRALLINSNQAAAYKYRGRAHRLLGQWEKAAHDLRQACKIDMDEEADEWLREVTPNARKLEEHKRKYERKRAEKELRERTERMKRAREEHAKAAERQREQEKERVTKGHRALAAFQHLLTESIDGILVKSTIMAGQVLCWGLKANAHSNRQAYSDRQTSVCIATFQRQDPEVLAAFEDIESNPANITKYQDNPKILAIIEKLAKLKGGLGGMMGGMGGMGGFGGFNPFGGANQPPPQPPSSGAGAGGPDLELD
ncbi:uncharacterized protein LOC111057083 [Nilaparvata lugens]|uniref:uncharacterized protein LOC111057083 n=1 Tax=Nilaparvata lugens TaxID=108931 RepID=UPI00193D70BC|nr:uncharacterized protein LOC111057083 [Nilaparvata lugens]